MHQTGAGSMQAGSAATLPACQGAVLQRCRRGTATLTSCRCPVLLEQACRGLPEGLLQRMVPRCPLAPPPLQLGQALPLLPAALVLRAAA